MNELVERVHVDAERAGRNAEPNYGLVDSQNIKTTLTSEERGIDVEKWFRIYTHF
jgi:hypothetical protein